MPVLPNKLPKEPFVPVDPAEPGVAVTESISPSLLSPRKDKPDDPGVVPGKSSKYCPVEGCTARRAREYDLMGPLVLALCERYEEVLPRHAHSPILRSIPVVNWIFATKDGDDGWYVLVAFAKCPIHGRVRLFDQTKRRKFSRFRLAVFWVKGVIVACKDALRAVL